MKKVCSVLLLNLSLDLADIKPESKKKMYIEFDDLQ